MPVSGRLLTIGGLILVSAAFVYETSHRFNQPDGFKKLDTEEFLKCLQANIGQTIELMGEYPNQPRDPFLDMDPTYRVHLWKKSNFRTVSEVTFEGLFTGGISAPDAFERNKVSYGALSGYAVPTLRADTDAERVYVLTFLEGEHNRIPTCSLVEAVRS